MSSDEPKAIVEGDATLKKYRKGMKDLGKGLIVLAIFQLVFGGAVILAPKFEPVILFILGGMGAVNLIMGLLLLRNLGWANYLVAVWSSFLLAINFLKMGIQTEQQQKSVSNPGSYLGFLIAGALLYYSVNNLQYLRKVRRSGL